MTARPRRCDIESHELLATDNARTWADEFVKTVRDHKKVSTDVDTMQGWFANAMCAAVDAERRRLRQRSREATITPAQKALQEKHDTPEGFEEAIWRAHAQLFVTTDEALTAIAKYRNEWAIAGDVPASNR